MLPPDGSDGFASLLLRCRSHSGPIPDGSDAFFVLLFSKESQGLDGIAPNPWRLGIRSTRPGRPETSPWEPRQNTGTNDTQALSAFAASLPASPRWHAWSLYAHTGTGRDMNQYSGNLDDEGGDARSHSAVKVSTSPRSWLSIALRRPNVRVTLKSRRVPWHPSHD